MLCSQARRRRDLDILQTLIAIGGQLGQFCGVSVPKTSVSSCSSASGRPAPGGSAATLWSSRASPVALDRVGSNDLLDALLARIAEVLDADTRRS